MNAVSPTCLMENSKILMKGLEDFVIIGAVLGVLYLHHHHVFAFMDQKKMSVARRKQKNTASWASPVSNVVFHMGFLMHLVLGKVQLVKVKNSTYLISFYQGISPHIWLKGGAFKRQLHVHMLQLKLFDTVIKRTEIVLVRMLMYDFGVWSLIFHFGVSCVYFQVDPFEVGNVGIKFLTHLSFNCRLGSQSSSLVAYTFTGKEESKFLLPCEGKGTGCIPHLGSDYTFTITFWRGDLTCRTSKVVCVVSDSKISGCETHITYWVINNGSIPKVEHVVEHLKVRFGAISYCVISDEFRYYQWKTRKRRYPRRLTRLVLFQRSDESDVAKNYAAKCPFNRGRMRKRHAYTARAVVGDTLDVICDAYVTMFDFISLDGAFKLNIGDLLEQNRLSHLWSSYENFGKQQIHFVTMNPLREEEGFLAGKTLGIWCSENKYLVDQVYLHKNKIRGRIFFSPGGTDAAHLYWFTSSVCILNQDCFDFFSYVGF